jgi:hypothetical protein
VDTCDHLALVHYDDGADMLENGDLRGILVDTEAGAIIASSFGYTPTAVSNMLVPKDGVLTLTDTESNTHTFNMEETTIKRVFEGVVIRVLWHKGVAYRITHRKIKPLRSRWGSSPYFLDIYREAGGPTDEQLFDLSKPFSSTCYMFLVVHPDLLVATRQKVTRPYIVFLSEQEMELQRPEDQVAKGVRSFTTANLVGGTVNVSYIHEPQVLSLEEANHHLKFGYFNPFKCEDERQLTGEAVILYRTVEGQIVDVLKVHSPSYEWRSTMRGNNPNVAHQFYCLLDAVLPNITTDEQWNTLKERLIMLPLYNNESLKQSFEQNRAIFTLPGTEGERSLYAKREARIHLLWQNYILALPPSFQERALDLLSSFDTIKNEVTEWIQSIETTNKNKDIETTDLHPRIKGIIASARKFSKDRIKNGTNFTAQGKPITYPNLIKNNIRNIINKEHGTSLYKLHKLHKQYQRDQQKDNEQKGNEGTSE